MKNVNFEISEEKTPEGIRVILSGHIDNNNAPLVERKLEEIAKRGDVNIVLNMNQVYYLCSSGIKVILKIYKETKNAGGKLKIEEPSPSVKNVLKITAFDEIFL